MNDGGLHAGKPIDAVALCTVLVACGQSLRTDTNLRDAGADRDADAAIEPTNCAYPRVGTPDPAFLEKTAALAEPGCRYQLGPEQVLPFEPRFAAYGFSFDVNGDSIGDIFFRDPSGKLHLALSRVTGSSLSYERADCDALGAIPDGRVLVRDLNRDGVPDLVAGPTSLYPTDIDSCPSAPGTPEVQAFLNLAQGFVEVFRHEWPDECNTKTTLLDVEVADFGGAADSTADISFGYGRYFGVTPGIEEGVAAVQIDAVPPNQAVRLNRWSEARVSAGHTIARMALGGDSAAPLMFIPEFGGPSPELAPGRVIRWDGAGFTERDLELEPPGDIQDEFVFHDHGGIDAWFVPLEGMPEVLAVLYNNFLALYDVSDATRTPVSLLSAFPTVWEHRWGEPFVAIADSFMTDIDGDGNLDFVERSWENWDPSVPHGEGPQGAAIHRGEAGAAFRAPATFPVSRFLDFSAESPFVRVGNAEGAIFVNNSSGPDGIGPPTFQMLECAPD